MRRNPRIVPFRRRAPWWRRWRWRLGADQRAGVIWFLAFVWFHDAILRLHGRWFRLTRERFDAISYGGMAIYKIGVLLFNLVPWLAPVVDDWRSGMQAMTRDCRVARVIDGDTVDLGCVGRGKLRARIVGYDAPELFSPTCAGELRAAERARDALATAVRQATAVEVEFRGHDRYGRRLVDMRLGGRRVAAAMVASGNGRRYLGHLRQSWCH